MRCPVSARPLMVFKTVECLPKILHNFNVYLPTTTSTPDIIMIIYYIVLSFPIGWFEVELNISRNFFRGAHTYNIILSDSVTVLK